MRIFDRSDGKELLFYDLKFGEIQHHAIPVGDPSSLSVSSIMWSSVEDGKYINALLRSNGFTRFNTDMPRTMTPLVRINSDVIFYGGSEPHIKASSQGNLDGYEESESCLLTRSSPRE
jgi:hypothetical protein